jgi:uncharacterized membrane protein YphA (DoxX/SURF4 family)
MTQEPTAQQAGRLEQVGRPEPFLRVAARRAAALTSRREADRAVASISDHPEAGPRVNTAALALGRVVFGGYFVYNGINHFVNHGMLTGYARSKGIPAAGAAVAASGALILIGGLSLMTGARPRVGAWAIGTFLAGVTPSMHAFWAAGEQERMPELVNFTKNVALVGGAALAAAVPEPWPGSVRI